MMAAFAHLQVSQLEIKQIIAIVSAVLHLGNIDFVGGDTVSLANPKEMKIVCDLLQVEERSMERTLVCAFTWIINMADAENDSRTRTRFGVRQALHA